MKAVVAAFNQEKALVGAFSVITNLRMDLFEAPVNSPRVHLSGRVDEEADYLLAGLDVAALEAGGHLVHALPEDVAVQGARGGQMGLGLATQETN